MRKSVRIAIYGALIIYLLTIATMAYEKIGMM